MPAAPMNAAGIAVAGALLAAVTLRKPTAGNAADAEETTEARELVAA